jgi:hypothetical protein
MALLSRDLRNLVPNMVPQRDHAVGFRLDQGVFFDVLATATPVSYCSRSLALIREQIGGCSRESLTASDR